MAEFSAPLSIFPAKEKKSENSPDYTGTVEISTAELQSMVNYLRNADHEMNWKDEPVIKLRISAWSNETKGGQRYLKGSLQPPYKPDAATPSPATPSSAELPF